MNRSRLGQVQHRAPAPRRGFCSWAMSAPGRFEKFANVCSATQQQLRAADAGHDTRQRVTLTGRIVYPPDGTGALLNPGGCIWTRPAFLRSPQRRLIGRRSEPVPLGIVTASGSPAGPVAPGPFSLVFQ